MQFREIRQQRFWRNLEDVLCFLVKVSTEKSIILATINVQAITSSLVHKSGNADRI